MPTRYAAGGLLLVLLAGCGTGASDQPGEPTEPTTSSASPSSTSSPGSTATPATPSSTPTATTTPSGGEVTPTPALLDWSPVVASPEGLVVQGVEWSVRVNPAGTRAKVAGPGPGQRVAAGPGRRIDQVLLDDEWLVLVAQAEDGRPAKATVLELATGEGRRLTPRPAPAGDWAMHGGTLHYPTTGPEETYCLAAFHLPSGQGEVDYCAPPQHGFSNVVASSTTTALMTFDDTRPVSCRTLATLTDGVAEPLPGVPECVGWDVAATPTGAVWSVLPDEQQVEAGRYHATADGATYDLGVGATGTLTPCGDSVYFARNAAAGRPAQLLRWTPDATLEVVYAARGTGPGFLSEPACAGSVLTVTSFGAGGDEVVSATAP